MRFISKIIFFYLFLYSFSINASVQKPSIAFFILDKNNNNQSDAIDNDENSLADNTSQEAAE